MKSEHRAPPLALDGVEASTLPSKKAGSRAQHMSEQPFQPTTLAGRWRQRAAPLGLVCLVHLGLVWWMANSLTSPPLLIVPPAVMGMLVQAPPVTEPKPLPVAPPPPPPKLQPRPVVRKAVEPPPPGPPSERAVAPPPAVTPTPTHPVTESAPPVAVAATPAPPPPAAEPVPITPPRSDAAHLDNPAPTYPPVSRRMQEEGRVLLDVYILPDGSVGDIKLKRTSGHTRLDQAALDAVRRWKYQPARKGNVPIPYWYVQPIDFSLNS